MTCADRRTWRAATIGFAYAVALASTCGTLECTGTSRANASPDASNANSTGAASFGASPEGGRACKPVSPVTEAGTCPVLPPSGLVCDFTDIASVWCWSPDCPASAGCGGYGSQSGETCFAVCGALDAGIPRETACVTEGACATASDCQGSLPHICNNCPLSPDGQGSQGCAHWACNAGRCDVGYCEPGLVCQAGQGCPWYYLPPVDRSCTTAADCVLVDHRQTCCLTVTTAVRASEAARFAEIESQCASIHDPFFYECGCQGSTTTEDGAYPGLGQDIEPSCVAGTCKAVVGGRLRCGATTCDPGQTCCTSPGDGGYCVYSCAASCPVTYDDAGLQVLIACRG